MNPAALEATPWYKSKKLWATVAGMAALLVAHLLDVVPKDQALYPFLGMAALALNFVREQAGVDAALHAANGQVLAAAQLAPNPPQPPQP